MTINRANQLWALDTTYIPMARGFVYLMRISDERDRLFGIVTDDFGNVTGHFGSLTSRTGRQDWRCA